MSSTMTVILMYVNNFFVNGSIYIHGGGVRWEVTARCSILDTFGYFANNALKFCNNSCCIAVFDIE